MPIDISFAFILTICVLATGLLCLIDLVFFKKKREEKQKKTPGLVHFSYEYFPIFLVVFLIRSFLIQPYHVPTGSLSPTIKPGEFIIGTQFSYGLRLPVTNTKIFKTGEPKRGDIVLFYWPKNPNIIFVKRVVGLPGDHISYHNKILKINGIEAKQTFKQQTTDGESVFGFADKVTENNEDLLGVNHSIFLRDDTDDFDDIDLVVPSDNYFMMGDNRDNSDDSRDWGSVPDKYLIGKAQFIVISYDKNAKKIDFSRMFKRIK